MYYEERIINGVVCYRTTPNGRWYAFDIKELSAKYAELKDVVLQMSINELNLVEKPVDTSRASA